MKHKSVLDSQAVGQLKYILFSSNPKLRFDHLGGNSHASRCTWELFQVLTVTSSGKGGVERGVACPDDWTLGGDSTALIVLFSSTVTSSFFTQFARTSTDLERTGIRRFRFTTAPFESGRLRLTWKV